MVAAQAMITAARKSPDALAIYCDPGFQPVGYQLAALKSICGTSKRVIVVLPPSHGRKTLAHHACVWMLATNPSTTITLASHSEEKAVSLSRDIRDRFQQNPRFRSCFPAVQIHPKVTKAEAWKTTNNGGIRALRVGESIQTCDVLVIAEPHEGYAAAASATNRDKVWDWYVNAAYTKLSQDGKIVVIGSRAHDQDLIGRLIAQGGWTVVEHSAVTESGSALWPERVPIDYLRKIEAGIGAPAWQCTYLGKPQPTDSRGSSAMPRRESFREFLELDAMVPGSSASIETRGTFTRFTLEGREAIGSIVDCIDEILRGPIKDAQVAIAGGAQWGKTTIQHAFMGYATGQMFRNVMTFLPDEKLVTDVVQTKFRPVVIDQMPWFASMIQMGKVTNESGKSVDRIGAFSVTDGIRKANGMFLGLNKVPTTHSADIGLVDELDDVNPANEKFVAGRLTTSDLRLIVRAGTQRVHGRGMNKAWKDGSQGIVMLTCGHCGLQQNPEDSFPGIVCTRRGDRLGRLTFAADFRDGDDVIGSHEAGNEYFLGCIKCGTELDRRAPEWKHKRLDQIRLNNWSFRISQLSIAAIELGKIVNDWTLAVQSDDKMLMFRTDVLAIPKSTAQKLTPEIVDRARRIEVFDVAPKPASNLSVRYGGLDMGGRCWFVVREFENSGRKRIVWAESIPLHQVGSRVPQLCDMLNVSCTFIDQMPETKESRTLALRLNGLDAIGHFPRVPDTGQCHVSFGNGLSFVRDDNGDCKWQGLRAAVVRFDKKRPGQGIEMKPDYFEGPHGSEICVPMLVCNRFEAVDAVVREFLTPSEGEMEMALGSGLRNDPAIRLPTSTLDVWREFDEHHISGSEREKDSSGSLGDYVDGIANHFLFANAYSRLAEVIGARSKPVQFTFGRASREKRTGGL